MYFPGEWIDDFPAGDRRNVPRQPDSSAHTLRLQKLKITIVPRKYNPAEKLSLEHWDPDRLAEHCLATMPSDCGPAAVEFIMGSKITGSFLLNYADQIEDMVSGSKCELTSKIVKILQVTKLLPCYIPKRRPRFTSERYDLPEIVKELEEKFSISGRNSLVADEWDWEVNASSSALGSDLERRLNSESGPVEGASPGPLVPVEPAASGRLPRQAVPRPLSIAFPQTTLGLDIFTSPALVELGFRYDFPAVPAPSRPPAQSVNPVGPVDNASGGPSGSNAPGKRTHRTLERHGGSRGQRFKLSAVAQVCPFLCFGAMLAPFRGFAQARSVV